MKEKFDDYNEYEKFMKNKCNNFLKYYDKRFKIQNDEYINERIEKIKTEGLNYKFNRYFDKLISLKKNFDYVAMNKLLKERTDKKKLEKEINRQRIQKQREKYLNLIEQNIEEAKKVENLDIKKTLNNCQDCIVIAEKLGEKCTNTEWYKEIKTIQQTLIQKTSISAPPPSHEIEQEFKDNFNFGIDTFLKFLLSKYPIEGYEFSEQIIEEYNKNKRKFFVLLKQKYNKANSFKPSLNGVIDNSYFQEKKNYIIQYINNCLNALK